jgi:hypothetical protein
VASKNGFLRALSRLLPRTTSPGQLLLERLVTGETGSVLDSKIARVDALYSPEWLSGWRPLEEQRKVTRVFRRSILGSIACAGLSSKLP